MLYIHTTHPYTRSCTLVHARTTVCQHYDTSLPHNTMTHHYARTLVPLFNSWSNPASNASTAASAWDAATFHPSARRRTSPLSEATVTFSPYGPWQGQRSKDKGSNKGQSKQHRGCVHIKETCGCVSSQPMEYSTARALGCNATCTRQDRRCMMHASPPCPCSPRGSICRDNAAATPRAQSLMMQAYEYAPSLAGATL